MRPPPAARLRISSFSDGDRGLREGRGWYMEMIGLPLTIAARYRFFYRFVVRCAALVLALAVVEHRSPRLGVLTSDERIREKKRRPRAVQAVLLRTRGQAEKAPSSLPDREPVPAVPRFAHRTPDSKLTHCARRANATPRAAPRFVTRHIPRMGSDEPPRR